MNLKLPNNKVTILIAGLLLIALFSSVYFLDLYPKMKEIPLKESELSSQEQLLSVLQGKVTKTNTNTFQSTVALQKVVPVKPLTQQLLLEIEKAEVVSGSFVVNMQFEDGEVTADTSKVEENKLEERIEEDLDPESNSESVEVEKEEVMKPLPTGVKKVSVTLNVESPSYFEFEEFIRILENSERITVIEAIDFTAGEEIIEYEQTDKPLSYQVTLSAFYMPGLSDLVKDLPKMETPKPADKKNPLSKFSDYTKSESGTATDN